MNTLNDLPILFNIEITYSPDIATVFPVAAASYGKYNLPNGPVIPGDKGIKLDPQEEADYYAFIENIEDLLEDSGLQIIYKENSTNYSKYYSCLANDDKGNSLFKFRLRLRISNHEPHRTNRQRANKAAEKKAVEPYLNGKHPSTLTKIIVVNNQKYSTYLDAFMYIYDEVNRWLEIMRR